MGNNESLRNRQDGFLFAYLFLKEHSIEELEEEIRIRNLTGVKINLTHKELNDIEAIINQRDYLYQGLDLLFMTILRKRKFGKTRLERNLNFVMKNRVYTIFEAYEQAINNGIKLEKVLKSGEKRYHTDVNEIIKNKPDKKVLRYMEDRENGIIAAINIAKEFGTDEVEKRKCTTSYVMKLSDEEIKYGMEVAHVHFNEAAFTEWLVSLIENEGYGEQRLNQVMDDFQKMYTLIKNGTLGYENYMMVIEKTLGYQLASDQLRTHDHWGYKDITKYIKDDTNTSKEFDEPNNFDTYPCFKCKEKSRCKKEGYKEKCVAYGCYYLKRREAVLRHTGKQ